jgi:hypothetical protein
MSSHQNAQLILFDKDGVLLKSCDTLFKAAHLLGKNIFTQYPILKCIEKDIYKKSAQGEPLFVPHIAFSVKEFRSICDFAFIKNEDIKEDIFAWMIYNNEKHYHCLIAQKKSSSKSFQNEYSLKNENYIHQYITH